MDLRELASIVDAKAQKAQQEMQDDTLDSIDRVVAANRANAYLEVEQIILKELVKRSGVVVG